MSLLGVIVSLAEIICFAGSINIKSAGTEGTIAEGAGTSNTYNEGAYTRVVSDIDICIGVAGQERTYIGGIVLIITAFILELKVIVVLVLLSACKYTSNHLET